VSNQNSKLKSELRGYCKEYDNIMSDPEEIAKMLKEYFVYVEASLAGKIPEIFRNLRDMRF